MPDGADVQTNKLLHFGVLTHDHSEAQPPAKHFYVGLDFQLHTEPNTGALTRSRYETAKLTCLADMEGWIRDQATAHQHLTQGVSEHDSALVLGNKDWRPEHDRAVTISRSNDDLPFRQGNGLMCIDTDSKVAELSFDDVWTGLCAAEPQLSNYSALHCSSSSSLVTCGETSTGLRGSHTFLHVADATDIPRTLDVLHVRACLAGYQTHRVSETGGFLARSIVDKALKTPSQPIYLRARVTPPVTQEKRVYMRHGAQEVLDTRAVIADLTDAENAAYAQHVAEHTKRLRPKMDRVRTAYVDAKVARLVTDRGITEDQARKHVETALTGGVLYPDWTIRVRDQWTTVGDILANPDQWHGVACYDPVDPENTSRTTAKIFTDKAPIINSFAHSGGDKGRVYKLMQKMPDAKPEQIAHLQLLGVAPQPTVHSDGQFTLPGVVPAQVEQVDWGEPVDVLTEIAVPSLPQECVPPVLRPVMLYEAPAIGVPPEVLFAACMGAAVATVTDELNIKPHMNRDWKEQPRIWIAAIGDPSIKKSPAFSKALKPVYKLDSAARDRDSFALHEYDLQRRRVEQAERRLVRHTGDGDPPEVPPCPSTPSRTV